MDTKSGNQEASTQRKSTEEQFFDDQVQKGIKPSHYESLWELDFQETFLKYMDTAMGDLSGKRVLEYGCGQYGDITMRLLGLGAGMVVAVDISGKSIRSSRLALRRAGRYRHTHFLKVDCEDLSFGNAVFDIIAGRAILHHLDMEQAATELRRVLKPGGRAVLIEPLGMNPLLTLYRKLTPGMRTPDEHPLKEKDFKVLERHFDTVEHKEFNFLTLPLFFMARFLKNKGKLAPLLRQWVKADQWVLSRVPFLSKLAWTTVISLQKKL